MPALVNYPGDSGLVFSISPYADIYCPPRKRSRITGPCVVDAGNNNRRSIDLLPDECLFEIFRRLPGGREKSISACVSKRWLTVLSNVRNSEFCRIAAADNKSEDVEMECDGYLTRSVEGKKATDLRLAAIAVGTSGRGGLGKLSIRGGSVTNSGLSAIARGCPSLKDLSMWNVSSINDDGLSEIARECRSLEKLDLCQCLSVSDKGVSAIAQACPNLTTLTIESCPSIGNAGLQAVAKFCPNLQSVTIKDCGLVGDQGISSLVSSLTSSLSKLKLQGLKITDYSVAVIGHYGKALTNLILTGLQNVSQKGFWVMGNARGLQSLSSLTVTACRGLTDTSLEAMGRGCLNLKQICLRKCPFVSDNGLVAFAKAAVSLESLQLEECNRISQVGILSALSSSSLKLKSVSVIKCMGIKDLPTDYHPMLPPCESLRCLSIRNCPGFGSASLAMVGRLCPQLHHLDLSGLLGITDAGLLPLLECSEKGLVKVNLSDCSNLTDEVVLSLAQLHGQTLKTLNLSGCLKITDASLAAIAHSCPLINDLDVSKCVITDSGVSALSNGVQTDLQILSLSGCSMVSSKSAPALENLGTNLVGLNLLQCHSISSHTIELLTGNLWKCDILS